MVLSEQGPVLFIIDLPQRACTKHAYSPEPLGEPDWCVLSLGSLAGWPRSHHSLPGSRSTERMRRSFHRSSGGDTICPLMHASELGSWPVSQDPDSYHPPTARGLTVTCPNSAASKQQPRLPPHLSTCYTDAGMCALNVR